MGVGSVSVICLGAMPFRQARFDPLLPLSPSQQNTARQGLLSFDVRRPPHPRPGAGLRAFVFVKDGLQPLNTQTLQVASPRNPASQG